MPESDDVEIVEAGTGAHLDAVRALFRMYAQALTTQSGGAEELAAQGFEGELSLLPGDYAAPHGALLLALVNGAAAGCAALRPLGDATMELKRLFVLPAYRGQSLGRRLVNHAMDRAARLGAGRMRLDTLPSMRSAARLYRDLGFEEIAAYRSFATPGTRFFELHLDPAEPEAQLVDYRSEFAADFERLNREWLEEFFHVEDKDLRYFADPAGTIIEPGGRIVFVQEGSRRVGTCAVIRRDAGAYELAKMAVQSDCRGKGYGQWLVTAAIEFARSRGAVRLYLLSDEQLSDALRLYERVGFVRRPFPGGTGYERGNVYMDLALRG